MEDRKRALVLEDSDITAVFRTMTLEA